MPLGMYRPLYWPAPKMTHGPVIVLSVTMDRLKLLDYFFQQLLVTWLRDPIGFGFEKHCLLFVETSIERFEQDIGIVEALLEKVSSHFKIVTVPVEKQPAANTGVVGPKWCVYSAAKFIVAPSYLLLDIDVELRAFPLEIYDYLNSSDLFNPYHIVCTTEMFPPSVESRYHALYYQMFSRDGIYHGVPSDCDMLYDEASSPTTLGDLIWRLTNTPTINTGVLILGVKAIQHLNSRMTYNHAYVTRMRAWVTEQAENYFTGHREQALVNFLIAELTTHSHKFPTSDKAARGCKMVSSLQWNLQTVNHDVAPLSDADYAAAKIIHFNGLAGNGPSRDFWSKRGHPLDVIEL